MNTHRWLSSPRAISVRQKPDSVLREMVGMMGLVTFLVALLTGIGLLVATLHAVELPKPETRCFQTMTKETNYCRSQTRW